MKIKRILSVIGGIVIVLLLIIAGYFLYVMHQYYRIPDKQPLEIYNPVATAPLEKGKAYTAVTYNIGFGAYDPEYSFFMETGTMDNGQKTKGKYGKGKDKETILKDTNGCAETVQALSPDFVLIQEMDRDSTRSYHVDQKAIFDTALSDYSSDYAINFHTAYLMFPLYDPHGASLAGIATYSRWHIEEAVRMSYPIDNSFPQRYMDLDRCFSVQRLPVKGGKELVLINSHMSAYDKGGKIRKLQLEKLNSFMQAECDKGNYVIAGGDFNHALGKEVLTCFPSQEKVPMWANVLEDSDLASSMHICKADNEFEIPTCRSSDLPYTKGINYSTVIDGFLLSPGISATAHNISNDFAYSDHQPVRLSFTLE
ncbi:MAG: endonuclease [Spirochaetia bacterium]|jgi:endonuclease/exonuclease/phosphatase family metal-dependent hydrolase|nr:endonuclease [Spirochaetia bacterium]